MSVNLNTNKRAHSSTTSDFDSNTSALEQSVFVESTNQSSGKSKKKKKTNTQTQRKNDDFVNNVDLSSSGNSSTIEEKIDEIIKRLSNVLTKNDSSFIKEIIKSTLDEMKEQILTSVTKRIEILEGELHEKCVETENLKKEIKERASSVNKLSEENKQLKLELKSEIKSRENDVNELEQYSRRNNIRIFGIPNDDNRQQSTTVSELVIKTLNDKGNLHIKPDDIDVAHRLGRWERGKNRPVIVKLVRRQTKIEIMKRGKDLRINKVYANEDLTRLNQQVLSSIRLKDTERVSKCWSFEGKLYVIYKNSDRHQQVKFNDYEAWLNKPWPKRNR